MPYAAARDGNLLQERVSEGVCQNTTGCRESLGQRRQRQGSLFSAITRDAPRDTGRLVMHCVCVLASCCPLEGSLFKLAMVFTDKAWNSGALRQTPPISEHLAGRVQGCFG